MTERQIKTSGRDYVAIHDSSVYEGEFTLFVNIKGAAVNIWLNRDDLVKVRDMMNEALGQEVADAPR